MRIRVVQAIQLLLLASGIRAQVFSYGNCPKYEVKQNFDKDKYLGKWYEYSNYFAVFQLFGKCVVAEYTDKSDGAVVKIGVKNSSKNTIFGTYSSVTGTAVLAEPDNSAVPASLIVNFGRRRSSKANYNIIDTDYDNYAIVYFCKNEFFFFKSELLWILTRAQKPDPALIAQTESKIKAAGIDTSRLKKTDQTGC